MTLDDLDRLDGLESDLVECAIELRNAIKLLEAEEVNEACDSLLWLARNR